MPAPTPLNGMDSAASALRYWERKQEVVANNLANVSTDGFKAQRVFAKLLDGVRPTADATSDLSVGTLKQTTNDLDVAINGNGFFVVQTANGERYTRGGSLHIDPKHQLVDVNGNPLLGQSGKPITLGDGPISIDHTGAVKQGEATVDTLRMEDAPKDAQLQHEGDSLWIPPATKTVIAPTSRNVKQGYVEESNVNSLTTMVDMVAVQRAYASVQKAITELDHANETVTTQLARPL
jgi:flagellar basal-body rod protein FlgF